MPRLRPTSTALRLFSDVVEPQNFVCRACRAQQHSIRFLHSSRAYRAEEVSLFQRLRDSVFGSKESKELSKRREEAQANAKVGDQRVIRFKGVDYTIAPLVNPTDQTEYKQAYNWDDLENIGGEEWVKRKADRGEVYTGFAASNSAVLTGEQWDSLLHTVLVEALLLARTGGSLKRIFEPHDSSPLRSVIIVPGETTATTKLEGVSENVLAKGSKPRSSGAVVKDTLLEEVQSGTLGSSPQPTSAWMSMSLDDANVKFTIVKRILQLTGRRVSDSAMSKAKTVQDLRGALVYKEPPKKLAHSDSLRTINATVPNVSVYDRRRTPIDKDNEVGRWKVIEEELRKRGLPVTGTSWPTAKTTVPTN